MPQRFWIDASGILYFPRARVSGVQRVEAELLREVLSGRRPEYGVCAFCGENGNLVALAGTEREELGFQIETMLKGEPWNPRILPPSSRFRRLIARHEGETRRQLAADIAGASSGIAYAFVKAALRQALKAAALARRARDACARLRGRSGCVMQDPRNVVLVSYSGLMTMAGGRQLARTRARLVHVFYDLIPLDHPEFVDPGHVGVFTGYIMKMVSHHDLLLAISHASRDRLLEWAGEKGLPQPNVITCQLGGLFTHVSKEDAGNSPITELEGQGFAVYCTTIAPSKNHVTLVRAWERLAREIGADKLPHLAMLGHFTTDFPAIRQQVEHSEIRDLLHPIADASDSQVSWAYRNAMFGVFPSRAEGWGLGVSECMLHGLPVLISDTPSLNEAAQGLMPVLPATHEGAWAGEIRRIVEEPGYLESLRESAREYRPRTAADLVGDVFAHLESCAPPDTRDGRAVRPPSASGRG